MALVMAQFRDLKPEAQPARARVVCVCVRDFELLCALDESIPKRRGQHCVAAGGLLAVLPGERNVMPRNKLQNLGTAIARECGATECGICLMALDPEAQHSVTAV
eukprot:5888811-Amphidinium_carterae.1